MLSISEEIRIKALELAQSSAEDYGYRTHDQQTEGILKTAKKYEDYITNGNIEE